MSLYSISSGVHVAVWSCLNLSVPFLGISLSHFNVSYESAGARSTSPTALCLHAAWCLAHRYSVIIEWMEGWINGWERLNPALQILVLGCSPAPSFLAASSLRLNTLNRIPTPFPLWRAKNPVWPQPSSDSPTPHFPQGIRHRLRGSVNAVRIRAPQIGGERLGET